MNLIRDPLLIVEVRSPRSGLCDQQIKVADYRRTASVEEILIDSACIFAEVLRREDERWTTEIFRGPQATPSLASGPATIFRSFWPLFLAGSERLRDNRRMTDTAHNQHSETRRPSDRDRRNNRAQPFPARPSESVALR